MTRTDQRSSQPRSESPVRVGVLSLHNSKETKAILNAVEALGHEPEWLRAENTVVRIRERDAELSPDVDVIANRLLLSNTDQPAEELGLARTLEGIRPMLNTPDATARAAHKTAAAIALVNEGLPVPKTALALSNDQLKHVREEFGSEAVYKTAIGTHGGGAWKVLTTDPLTARVGKRRAFLQELIGCDGETPRDLRVYVVGDRVIGAMHRHAAEGDWRTNVARGGSVEDVTDSTPKAVLDLARRAAATLGLDYAGVDLIEGDGEWYILEVNPTAGFRGLYQATGRSPAPYIAQQAIEYAGGSVDADRVEGLASTLDDSVPRCKPAPKPVGSEEAITIGFTEQVVVSGTSGTKTVVAKSDSGAARTSIDLRLAADIGAGPIHTVSRVRSGSSKQSKTRPVVDLVIGIGGEQYTVAANIEDRTHMTHSLLLGRDVLKNYHLDVGRRVESHAEIASEE
ncbi:RimK family alpha-L-glutamate ligase [Halogeometricum luteum]|uniref:RimK family alpha-L-glutamate ligase n=1 Tax=Halogeometricum luteum TaxID=2950537 RepID=A0ABU2G600_9EURY|nr:RimK family alpha-L-glutamate ligase [Halogeometricum sp. S3BR5-2]MDS0296219.1 RimK family alpha-L-glutamate ligase [Halogeometricum sp. S3BR5-2]